MTTALTITAAPVALNEWEPHKILAGQVSASSLQKYRGYLAAYRQWCRDVGQEPLTPQTFMAWRDHLVLDTTYSANTINTHLAGVKRIMREAGLRGYVAVEIAEAFEDVAGVSRKALKKRGRPHARIKIAADEMRRFCDAPPLDTPIGLRNRALLHTLASSGVRISEAVALKTEDIRRRGRGWGLLVQGKTEEEQPRETPLSREAKTHIDAWLHARALQATWVFTAFQGRSGQELSTPLTTSSAWVVIKQYARRVADQYEADGDPRPHLRHVKPHDFRRFVGTTLARSNAKKAQLALGHADPSTTLRSYVMEELDGDETEEIY